MVTSNFDAVKRNETVSENVDARNAVENIVEVVQRGSANLNVLVDP